MVPVDDFIEPPDRIDPAFELLEGPAGQRLLYGASLPKPIGTDEAGAMAYLGCTRCALTELRRRKILKMLKRGWYAYADLDQAVEDIRRARDAKISRLRTGGKTPREFLR